ncbi:unnamed protein product [Rotaria sp. Silwood1]|nr:unnamed protein product [Rotaria sp. Silwood1]
MWTPEINPVPLRNYQSGETLEVTGPMADTFNDCRHYVCTTTFMSLPAHSHMSHAIKGNPVNELESLQPDYLKNEAHDYLRIFHWSSSLKMSRQRGTNGQALLNVHFLLRTFWLFSGMFL